MRIFIALTCLAAALSFGGAPASAQQATAARPNILENDPACEGYTTANYRDIYNANAAGQEAQRHAFCAAAYAYYDGYMRAVNAGHAAADTENV